MGCGFDSDLAVLEVKEEAIAVAEKDLAFLRARVSSISAFRLFSLAALARRSANVDLGFCGEGAGAFQGFFKETSLAFLPRSIPSTTRCGEVGAGARMSVKQDTWGTYDVLLV